MSPTRPGNRRRTAITLALVVVIVAIPLGVYLWGRSSESFTVSRVEVSGQRRVPRREAQRVLEARYLGKNLFTVTDDQVRDTLSVFPYVADVSVDRDYPETLRVRIDEYVPEALLLADGAWYVLSAEGVVVARLDPTPERTAGASPRPGESKATPTPNASPTTPNAAPATPQASPSPASSATAPAPSRTPSQKRIGPLPVPPGRLVPRGLQRLPIMATDVPVTLGEVVDDPLVLQGLQVIAALPDSVRRDVAAAKVTGQGARVYLRPSLEVEFGNVDDLQVKVLALQAVLRRYRARGVKATFVDVSVPTRPLGAPLLPTPRAP